PSWRRPAASRGTRSASRCHSRTGSGGPSTERGSTTRPRSRSVGTTTRPTSTPTWTRRRRSTSGCDEVSRILAALAAAALVAVAALTLRDDQVRQRLQASAALGDGEPDAAAPDPFTVGSVEAQLLVEAVYRQLADPIRTADPEQRQAERNAALRRWLDGLAAR